MSRSEMLQTTYPTNVHQEVLKQFPHVVGGVNLLHLHFCVDIAVVQEVDVGNLHLLVSTVNKTDSAGVDFKFQVTIVETIDLTPTLSINRNFELYLENVCIQVIPGRLA